MNITRENIDELNAVLKVEIEKTDYEEKVEKVLKDYRKKANVKGFRPGMVPIGLVKKMYGKAVQLDEINKIVSESIQNILLMKSWKYSAILSQKLMNMNKLILKHRRILLFHLNLDLLLHLR